MGNPENVPMLEDVEVLEKDGDEIIDYIKQSASWPDAAAKAVQALALLWERVSKMEVTVIAIASTTNPKECMDGLQRLLKSVEQGKNPWSGEDIKK